MNTSHVAAFHLVPSGSKFKISIFFFSPHKKQNYTLQNSNDIFYFIVVYQGGTNFELFGKEEKKEV